MHFTQVADGASTISILPEKILTAAAGNITSCESTTDVSGTVVLIGTGTVTLGYFEDEALTQFHPFSDGLMTAVDIFVRHGNGVRLGADITGASGLTIGYAGTSH